MRRIVSLAMLLLFALPLCGHAAAGQAQKLIALSFGLEKKGGVELVLTGDGAMPDPVVSRDDSHVIIEIPKISMDTSLPFALPVLVRAISYQQAGDGVRLFLTMEGTATWKKAPSGEERLVFALSSKVLEAEKAPEPAPALSSVPAEAVSAPPRAPAPEPAAEPAPAVVPPASEVPEQPKPSLTEEITKIMPEPQPEGSESAKPDQERVEPLAPAPEVTAAIPPKGEEGILTLEQCINTAITGHPDISAAAGAVGVSQSRVGQAEAGYYPQVGLSSSYSRQAPASPFTDNSFDQYTTNASVNQLVYDFGKTSTQVNIQKLNTNASRSDLEDTVQQVIFRVKNAYYGLLKAQRDRVVAAETVAQFEQRLQQAQGFYEVGRSPKFDVTKAEVDLSNARLNLIKAESALNVAKANLRTAMGVPETTSIPIEDTLSFRRYETSLDGAVQKAYENRSDLQSLKARAKAAEASIDLAKKDYYPVVSANANYEFTGERFPLEDGWSAGMTVTFPIFSGFLTKFQVAESRENLKVLRANEESLKLGILFDIQQAYLNLRDAESSISTAEAGVRQAEENLQLARGRYEVGVGNPIEVTDAVVAYANARSSYIQALYDYKISQATLERAMGER